MGQRELLVRVRGPQIKHRLNLHDVKMETADMIFHLYKN